MCTAIMSIISRIGIGPCRKAIDKHPTSVRLAAADLADLLRALDPAMCRGMYQSRK